MTIQAIMSANRMRGSAAKRRCGRWCCAWLVALTPPAFSYAAEPRASISGFSAGGGLFWTADQTGQFDAAPRLNLSAAAEVERATEFNWSPVGMGDGAFSAFAKVGHVSPSDLYSIDEMLWGRDGLRRNTTVSMGYRASFLGERMTVVSAVSRSSDTALDDLVVPLPFALPADPSRDGAAHWHKVDLTAIDEPGLRWTLSAEASRADPGFVANSLGRPRGALMIAGERRRLDTRLVADDVVVRATHDEQSNHLGARIRSFVSMAYSGVEAGFRSHSSAASSIERRADGVTVEISTHDLPVDAVEFLGDAAFLVPDLVSIDVEQGTSSQAGMLERDMMTSGFEVVASWSTPVGAFGLLYTREDERPVIAAAGVGLASKTALFDVSYQWRSGDWTASAGVFLMQIESGPGLSDGEETVAGRLSFGYEPENGVKLAASIGPSLDRYDWSEAEFTGLGRGLELSLSADLSVLAQDWTDRQDASLKLEYRGLIYDDAIPSGERQDRHALLASFNMTY